MEIIVCSNPDCRIAETGQCVEGLAREQCPRYGRPPAPLASDDEGIASVPEGVPLAPGTRLAVADAPDVLRACESRVIAIVGARESGKTSLIASLYALFQDGPIGTRIFARSDTLLAFEEASHDARALSARNQTYVERTNRGTFGFYHLCLCSPNLEFTELLLGDRAGEEYIDTTNDVSDAQALHEIARADVVTMLVDGERLLNLEKRHNLRGELRMMLQAFKDGDALTGNQRLAMVLTKLDALRASPDGERALNEFSAFVENMRSMFGNMFSAIEEFRIASWPDQDTKLRRGEGVPAVLEFWIEPGKVGSVLQKPSPPASRAFDWFRHDEGNQ